MVIPSNDNHLTIGKLCVGGDWACAHGDFGALREVVRQLESLVAEPKHCELVALEDACLAEPARASTLWCELKEQLVRGSTR